MENLSNSWICRFNLLAALSLFLAFQATAQITDAAERIDAIESANSALEEYENFPFRNIGPTIMSGRVVDIEGNPENQNEFFVAYASGGLWYTSNNGLSFEPVFDNELSLTIGDFEVKWADPIELWVGTGEVNSSRSSYAGTGMYYSNDTGRYWDWIGLAESHHIGRVILDNQDQKTLYVSVLGHLYTHNSERGVYKSTDNGDNWDLVLFMNDSTGSAEILQTETGDLYASMWERTRKAWNFDGEGEGSSVYHSDDGGESWEKISSVDMGFPEGPNCGRIGLTYDAQSKAVYALVAYHEKQDSDEEKEALVIEAKTLKERTLEELLELSDEDWQAFLEAYGFPEENDAADVKSKLSAETITIQTLHDFIGNKAEQDLFETDIIGAELYRYDSEAKSWTRTHDEPIEGLAFTYGYYFGQVRVDPFNSERIFLLGVPLAMSDDGGKTFARVDADHMHADHHDLWLNPKQKGHYISGNDGGLNISTDFGENWTKTNPIPVGQFYTVAVDESEPYRVYGGLQDNGVWVGPSNYEFSQGWLAEGKYPYQGIMGGDGMQIAIDPRDNNTVYTGYQFGQYFRIDVKNDDYNYITPQTELGEQAYRWNWQTPIHLSVHHPDVFYMGSQYFHRSLDRGESFETMSSDLTKGLKSGNVPYGTITTISESPLQFGLIITGSDDGIVSLTNNMGYDWKDISEGLPKDLWVSRVVASNHNTDKIFVALNGYRNDDFEPYLYVSNDQGDSYKKIGWAVSEPINVVLEDPVDSNLVFVGTDDGLYISKDGGLEFYKANNPDFPVVPVHDLVIAEKAENLVIGTHGRSIYTADISFLRTIDDSDQMSTRWDCEEEIKFSEYWGTKRWDWTYSKGPMLNLWMYIPTSLEAKLSLLQDGKALKKWDLGNVDGFGYESLELEIDPEMYPVSKKNPLPEESENGKIYLPVGEYTLELELSSGELLEKTLTISSED